MPRDIPVGNGRLLVCFDSAYRIRDLYYPHVGQENHVGGNLCRFGVWVDGRFSWVGQDWKMELRYETDTLVTAVDLRHDGLELAVKCRDAVDFHENVYLRDIEVRNLSSRKREVRLFFCHEFTILGNSVGDTAAFDPPSGGVVHYKGDRYFLANGHVRGSLRLFQFATGLTGVGNREGTFRDAEDGELSGNPIAQGSVDSVISLRLELEAAGREKAYYWICAGRNWDEVRSLDALVTQKSVEVLIRRTGDYWRLWAHKETIPHDRLPEKVTGEFRRSLLVLATQIDWQGGIVAANDSDAIEFNRDTYSYVWPRDGALAANALDMAGYPGPARNFYSYMSDRIEREGYFLHKYNPDGTLASSWHPWARNGHPQIPIQEDETALVIWALWHHFIRYRDLEFIKPFYRPVIKNAADFMCDFRDEATGLPDATYDLWEERRCISSFTVGAVFGGLLAASLFCTVFGEDETAVKYRHAAAEIRDAASLHLWRQDLNRFCRSLSRNENGAIEVDGSCDSSLWGLFAFGLFKAEDPKIQSTMAALKEKLWVKTDVGGMARYENDGYYRASGDVTGNPWFVSTLWYADYLVDRCLNADDMREPLEILNWVAEHALLSGVLAEQVHPVSGQPLSVSPLSWSHATFIATTLKILNRLSDMEVCPTCGLSLVPGARLEHWMEKLFVDACVNVHGMCRVG